MKTSIKGILFLLAACTLPLFSCTNVKSDHSKSSGVIIEKYEKKDIDDLALLCKIWGFLKYYHPEVSMGKFDIDSELFTIIPQILNVESKNERNRILEKWVSRFGEVRKWDTPPVLSPEEVKEYPDLEWINDVTNLGQVSIQLQKIRDAERGSDTTHYVSFPHGSSAFMWNENKYTELTSLDTGYRLLGLFRLWNCVQYYFAYKYLMDEKWDVVLEQFIPQFIESDGELGYKLTVLKMLTKLDDSHARILHPVDGSNPRAIHPDIDNWEGKYTLPFEITFIEDKAVITDFYPMSPKINNDYPFQIGDIILAVNNESVENIITRKLEYTPASHYTGKLKKIATSILRSNTIKMKVDYERDEKKYSAEFEALPLSEVEVNNRTRKDIPAYTKMDNEIVYIYIGSTQGGLLPEEFDEKTKGVIIDLRGFPNSIRNYWGYSPLFPDTVLYSYCTQPSIAYPGMFTYDKGNKVGKANPIYFKGKKVLLINEYTQSQPEYLAMQYGCAPNTILIGSKTTGADGNVSVVSLPGIDIMFTGVGVYYPDKSETQRIGILPDIEVKATIKGIREGRDEVLEKAIEYILQE